MNFIQQFYIRLDRFLKHLISPFYKSDSSLPFRHILLWLGDIPFVLIDLFFLDRIIAILLCISGNYRELTEDEITLGRSVYSTSINYTAIKVNNKVGSRISKMAHAYVLFNIVNFQNTIRSDVFIHELVHIWQYQKYGSVYIFRALLAQVSTAGYNYGGIEALYAGMIAGRKFIDFNFEQQGDIIQNAFLQRKGIRGIDNSMYTTIYNYYVMQLLD